MPYDLNGSFTRLYTWATEALSPPIATSKLDTQEEDIATALSNCVLRDGTGKPTANMDFNGKRITNLGEATVSIDVVSRTFGDSRYGLVLRAYKTANESVTSSTTLQNDDHLVVTVEASAVYAVRGYIAAGQTAYSSDIKMAFSVPSGATFAGVMIGVESDTAATNTPQGTLVGTSANDFPLSTGGGGNYRGINITGILTTSATAGSFQYQWAQQTSSGTAVVVFAGSWLILEKLS